MNLKCGVEGFKVRLHHLECNCGMDPLVRCTTRTECNRHPLLRLVIIVEYATDSGKMEETLLRLAFRKQHRSQIATNYKCHFGQAAKQGFKWLLRAVCRYIEQISSAFTISWPNSLWGGSRFGACFIRNLARSLRLTVCLSAFDFSHM